jgi:DNA repair photolyase
MQEYKSPYTVTERKIVKWCRYNARLDTYGRGCAHNCNYCYARHLLDFRGNWKPFEPAVADLATIHNAISDIKPGSVVKMGGMTDCFQPVEGKYHRTLETIKMLNDKKIHYLIVTKSATCCFPEYLDVYDPELAHFQISVTATDDYRGNKYETASPQSERIRAIETLQRLGFDTTLRLSPYIPQFVDTDTIKNIDCEKILIEFLKVNPHVMRCFDIDYYEYTEKFGGHLNLPLDRKIELAERFNGFKEHNVGEFVYSHYLYFRDNYNTNPFDCCNLRGITYSDYPEIDQDDRNQLTIFDYLESKEREQ